MVAQTGSVECAPMSLSEYQAVSASSMPREQSVTQRNRVIQLILATVLALLLYYSWPLLEALSGYFFVIEPPRPILTQALLDDSALALSREEVPELNAAWRADISRRHRPIRSLVSDDFSDLAFLAPLLEGKRIVQLGEAMHGVAESNLLKARLVRYLHQELNYDVLLFESPMTACNAADRRLANAPADSIMRECLLGVWQTNEVLPLFEYAKAWKKTDKPLFIAGFDSQDLSPEVGFRFKKLLEIASPTLASQVSLQEEQLKKEWRSGKPPDGQLAGAIQFYADVAAQLEKNKSLLEASEFSAPFEVAIAIRQAYSRKALLDQIAKRSDPTESSRARDKVMAENAAFLIDTVFRDRKVIVWAHNMHVAYTAEGERTPQPMGQLLAEKRRPEMYTIGLYMGRGVIRFNGNSLYRLSIADKMPMALMASAGRKVSFVDFSLVAPARGTEWLFEPLTDTGWLFLWQPITLSTMYDAILYIDRVTPQQYLEREPH